MLKIRTGGKSLLQNKPEQNEKALKSTDFRQRNA
jgi:hypothetical protein